MRKSYWFVRMFYLRKLQDEGEEGVEKCLCLICRRVTFVTHLCKKQSDLVFGYQERLLCLKNHTIRTKV